MSTAHRRRRIERLEVRHAQTARAADASEDTGLLADLSLDLIS